jgi:hypothetical protein
MHGIVTLDLKPTREFFLYGDLVLDMTKRIAVTNDHHTANIIKKPPGNKWPPFGQNKN